MTNLVFDNISNTAKKIASKTLSPVALIESILERIEENDVLLNSFITVTKDLALSQAKQAELEIQQGAYRGPLHGIPIALKDLFATKAIPTTFASNAYKDWIPDFNATVWGKLADAGAILVGKNNLSTLAADGTGTNSAFGSIRNAWNQAFISGGSSGGSAVSVAAGLAFGALGSDTAMSIRQPAALNGLVGLKPTFGRVSKYGVLPLSYSLDHVGPLTRNVKDTALMLQVIAGYDAKDPTSVNTPVPDFSAQLGRSLKGVRIGIPRNDFFQDSDPEWVKAVDEAIITFSRLGANSEDVVLPNIKDLIRISSTIILVEMASFHTNKYQENPDAFSDREKSLIEDGQTYSGVHYVQVQQERRKLSESLVPICTHYDVLALPTTSITTAELGSGVQNFDNTLPFNALGLPAISIPCGFDKNGIPIGLQLVGRAFAESDLLAVAHAFEQATEFHLQHPKV